MPPTETQLTVAPPTSFALGFGPGRAGPTMGADGSIGRYARSAISPLPFLGFAMVAIAAAWIGMHQVTPDAGTSGRHASAWWYNVTALLLPGERISEFVSSSTAEWVALSLLAIASLALVGLIARIGQNVRAGQGGFGIALPLLAFPCWWVLPITLGSLNTGNRTFLDNLTRFSFTLALALAQFVLVRWPALNRIWRSAKLRYDYLSVALWLPMMVPWVMYFGSTTFSLASTGEDGTFTDSHWLPTHNMVVWATWTTRVSMVAIFVLLVVVSVYQDIGIRQDRAEEAAARQQ